MNKMSDAEILAQFEQEFSVEACRGIGYDKIQPAIKQTLAYILRDRPLNSPNTP